MSCVESSTTRVEIGSIPGYVFSGESVELLCFVPATLVSFQADGGVWIDYLDYVKAGWSRRNARWGDKAFGGQHVFPDSLRPVSGLTAETELQVERWRHMAGVSAALCG